MEPIAESNDAHDRLRLSLGSRLPLVLQTEAAECGLACLSMALGYHGQHVDLSELRRSFGFSQKGATLKDLIAVADQLDARTRPLRLELDDLEALRTPCILHWDLNHFVVLKKVTRTGIIIHDPAVGVRRIRTQEVSRHFTGVALEVLPSTAMAQRSSPSPRIGVRAVLGRISGIRGALARVLLLAVAIELFAILAPFFLQWTIDHALVTADRSLLVTLVIGFSLLLLLRATVWAMRSWSLMGIQASLRVQSQANLFRHLIHLPTSFFENRNLGDILSRFGSQEEVLRAITTSALEAVMDGLLVILTLAIMFAYAPALALVVVCSVMLYGAVRGSLYAALRNATAEEIVWSARKDNHLLETVRGIRTIKLFSGLADRRLHWTNFMVEATNRHLTIEKLHILFRIANFVLAGGITIVVVWLGAWRVLGGTFTVGMLIAFLAYKDQFLDRVSALIDKAADLWMLRVHTERVADISLSAPEELGRTTSPDLSLKNASIEIRDLCFRYTDREPYVLDGVSLGIATGECVAIVGPSGCGKTTLLKVLASLLPPTSGEVLVSGRPLHSIGLEAYRSAIGVVMQDDQMFAGSIADNISFFASPHDPERIEQVARIASVHDEIASMPMGYDTLIGDMGTVLSGGQKQRVLLARALYRQPAILLLDEATSHLDVLREKAVSAAIAELKITRIIVAHRPETIRSADRILVLDKGAIVNDVNILSEAPEAWALSDMWSHSGKHR